MSRREKLPEFIFKHGTQMLPECSQKASRNGMDSFSFESIFQGVCSNLQLQIKNGMVCLRRLEDEAVGILLHEMEDGKKSLSVEKVIRLLRKHPILPQYLFTGDDEYESLFSFILRHDDQFFVWGERIYASKLCAKAPNCSEYREAKLVERLLHAEKELSTFRYQPPAPTIWENDMRFMKKLPLLFHISESGVFVRKKKFVEFLPSAEIPKESTCNPFTSHKLAVAFLQNEVQKRGGRLDYGNLNFLLTTASAQIHSIIQPDMDETVKTFIRVHCKWALVVDDLYVQVWRNEKWEHLCQELLHEEFQKHVAISHLNSIPPGLQQRHFWRPQAFESTYSAVSTQPVTPPHLMDRQFHTRSSITPSYPRLPVAESKLDCRPAVPVGLRLFQMPPIASVQHTQNMTQILNPVGCETQGQDNNPSAIGVDNLQVPSSVTTPQNQVYPSVTFSSAHTRPARFVNQPQMPPYANYPVLQASRNLNISQTQIMPNTNVVRTQMPLNMFRQVQMSPQALNVPPAEIPVWTNVDQVVTTTGIYSSHVQTLPKMEDAGVQIHHSAASCVGNVPPHDNANVAEMRFKTPPVRLLPSAMPGPSSIEEKGAVVETLPRPRFQTFAEMSVPSAQQMKEHESRFSDVSRVREAPPQACHGSEALVHIHSPQTVLRDNMTSLSAPSGDENDQRKTEHVSPSDVLSDTSALQTNSHMNVSVNRLTSDPAMPSKPETTDNCKLEQSAMPEEIQFGSETTFSVEELAVQSVLNEDTSQQQLHINLVYVRLLKRKIDRFVSVFELSRFIENSRIVYVKNSFVLPSKTQSLI